MKIRLSAFWAAFALAFGSFVLLGYFVRVEVVQQLRLLIMQWATLLAAAALILGLVNLLQVHYRRLDEQEEGWGYSVVLILSLLATFGLALFAGPDSEAALFVFNNIQFPVETSMMALLAVSLLVAGYRLVTRRKDVFSVLFVGTALLVMVGTGPWLLAANGPLNELADAVRIGLAQIVAAGGARGILLGVALGSVATGLRVLMGSDRPYGD